MKTGIVTVKTITTGLKGKKVLALNGIRSKLVKLDFSENRDGCQYGIEFDVSDYHEVISTLKENKIEYGVYKRK